MEAALDFSHRAPLFSCRPQAFRRTLWGMKTLSSAWANTSTRPMPASAYRPKDAISEFGRNVKIRLVQIGWSQTDLSDRLGITWQAVSSQLRVRSPRLRTVEQYAEALGVQPWRLEPNYKVRKGLRHV